MSWIFWLGLALLITWLVLTFGWHDFWRMDVRLPPAPAIPPSGRWPAVTAIVPARNEERDVERALRSLLAQDYPGPFRVILVDDGSEDGTGEIARIISRTDPRLTVLEAPPRPAGWSGKVAAMDSGIRRALSGERPAPEFLWLTDADIEHAPDVLRALVGQAVSGRTGLTSTMVRLHCESFWERLLVPPFVYFFFMLYPPKAVARSDRYAAGAAGGCMLLRTETLNDIGGMESIRGAIIDDCALARRVKDRGWRLWLGLSESSRSLRRYDTLRNFWSMVSRTAYEQLGRSPALLVLALAGLFWTFVLPALYALGFVFGRPGAHLPGLAAFGLMTATFLPVLRLYGLRRLRALLLPLAAVLHGAMTLSSALSRMTGRGGSWRGRTL